MEQLGSPIPDKQPLCKPNLQIIEEACGNYLRSKSGLLTIKHNLNPCIIHNGKNLSIRSLKNDHIVGIDEDEDVIVSIGLINHHDYLMVNGSLSKKITEPLIMYNIDTISTYFGDYQQGEMVYIPFI